jgi:hypothetical protein
MLLGGLFGEKLLGLTAFGNALDASADRCLDGAETVAVLATVELPLLRRLAEHAAELGRRGLAAPLVMTPEYINASLDSFPLEFLEISQRHTTVTGRDYFEALDIKPEHVRLQCEREFKRIVLRIQQGLLTSAAREQLVAELDRDVGRHVVRTLRGLLWIRGLRGYLPADEVIVQCGKIIGRPLAGVGESLNPCGEHGWMELQALYDDAEALASWSNVER